MKTLATLGSLMLLGLTLGFAQNVPANAVLSSKHYRESGVGNATGRSGSANMTARALLSKDGSSTIELTTGALDSPRVPPGSFAKVQFKPLDQSGNALFAQNFNHLSTPTGYYSFTSGALYRKQQIQLQANITGIDQNRTDVVTLVETVKRLPDVAVTNVTAKPSPAFTNQVVNISANVGELNGDSSATTICELFIYQGSNPGSPIDQANNVYVDAGGNVSCAFTHTFTAPGTYTIQVTAANVVPTDWDASNNSASTTITVTSPGGAEHGDAYFNDFKYSYADSGAYQMWNSSGALVEDYAGSDSGANKWQDSYARFQSFGCVGATNAVPWQFPANVAVTETMDGNPIYGFTDSGVTGYSYQIPAPAGGFAPLCNSNVASETAQMGSDCVGDHCQYLESYRYYDNGGTLLWIQQIVHSEKYAGDVTYWSQGYQCNYWWQTSASGTCASASDYYTWNSSYDYPNGTIVPVGSTWAAGISTLDSASNVFSGSISVPLTTSTFSSVFPNACSNFGPDANGNTYLSCSSSTMSSSFSMGSVSQ
jgi:hypothetical protein